MQTTSYQKEWETAFVLIDDNCYNVRDRVNKVLEYRGDYGHHKLYDGSWLLHTHGDREGRIAANVDYNGELVVCCFPKRVKEQNPELNVALPDVDDKVRILVAETDNSKTAMVIFSESNLDSDSKNKWGTEMASEFRNFLSEHGLTFRQGLR